MCLWWILRASFCKCLFAAQSSSSTTLHSHIVVIVIFAPLHFVFAHTLPCFLWYWFNISTLFYISSAVIVKRVSCVSFALFQFRHFKQVSIVNRRVFYRSSFGLFIAYLIRAENIFIYLTNLCFYSLLNHLGFDCLFLSTTTSLIIVRIWFLSEETAIVESSRVGIASLFFVGPNVSLLNLSHLSYFIQGLFSNSKFD